MGVDAAPAPEHRGWSGRQLALLAAVVVAGAIVRIILLPVEGFRGDIDQFVVWVHGIAVNGLPRAYDQDLTFGPVMAYIWGVLAAVEPAFKTVTDASDPMIRALMRTPASVADIGLAVLAAYALRNRPVWAIVAAAAIVFHPAVIDVTIWYSQYESIYVVLGLAALVLALDGHDRWAAVLLAAAVLTKPQALPFVLPFVAWFWVRGGIREVATCAAVGLATAVVLWLPFIPFGGPGNYLQNLAHYQQDIFPVLSLRAWNLWWIVQERLAAGQFVDDQTTILGPLSARLVGYGITVVLSLVVAAAIVRDPRPRTFVLGLAVATLVAFCFLTTMHERYAYGAVIFLMLLVPDRRFRWLALALGIVFTLNLLAAIPPTPAIAELIPIGGLMGLLGSVAMLSIMGVAFAWLLPRPVGERSGQDHRVAAVADAGGL
ncbi:MAG TPA: glycosyltransferase 87 family protein [Candidatus Limnocylindrales bacterium]|nr:glycosyltransferase 87 family protein [Candidatus Limnocylindrales bacterium]